MRSAKRSRLRRATAPAAGGGRRRLGTRGVIPGRACAHVGPQGSQTARPGSTGKAWLTPNTRPASASAAAATADPPSAPGVRQGIASAPFLAAAMALVMV